MKEWQPQDQEELPISTMAMAQKENHKMPQGDSNKKGNQEVPEVHLHTRMSMNGVDISELLFKQPESRHHGDCLICCVPLPFDTTKGTMMACCSKIICNGCVYANMLRQKNMKLEESCPFCREVLCDTDKECDKRRMRRIEANDPAAMHQQGIQECKKGNFKKGFEYYTKAAELGDVAAHWNLASFYEAGEYVVEKDWEMVIYHWVEAAIGGHPEARYNLGVHEWNNDNIERAVKLWITAATLGCDLSIKALMSEYRNGGVRKEDLEAALRAHKAAVDATKSPQRELGEEMIKYW